MPRPCPCKGDIVYKNSQPKDNQDQLYKETVLRHYRQASHRKPLGTELGPFSREEFRSCGDRITIGYTLSDGVIHSLGFFGEGCSISVASANMACEALEDLTLDDAKEVVRVVLLFLGELEKAQEVHSPLPGYPDLASLESLVRFPTRAACARLAWQGLGSLLNQ